MNKTVIFYQHHFISETMHDMAIVIMEDE